MSVADRFRGRLTTRAPFEPRSRRAGITCPNHRGSTYARRRLWITFWREFSWVFWGGFLEPIGPGASVQGFFSADGVLLVRWASANFDFFRGFFTFLVRFLPVFVPNFALFPSMPCAYLYVHNFPRTHVTLLRQGFPLRPLGYAGQVGGQASPGVTPTEAEGSRLGHCRLPFAFPQSAPFSACSAVSALKRAACYRSPAARRGEIPRGRDRLQDGGRKWSKVQSPRSKVGPEMPVALKFL